MNETLENQAQALLIASDSFIAERKSIAHFHFFTDASQQSYRELKVAKCQIVGALKAV